MDTLRRLIAEIGPGPEDTAWKRVAYWIVRVVLAGVSGGLLLLLINGG